MRALIVSDTHGAAGELQKVYEFYKAKADFFIHCGDSEQNASDAEMVPFIAVKGNCDFKEAGYEEEHIHNQDGLKWFITHGHLYQIKMSPLPLKYRAEEIGADIVCFGHTHHAVSFKDGKTVYINPGSIGVPKKPAVPTYCLADWDPDAHRLSVRLMTLDHQEIEEHRADYILNN